MIMRIYSKCKAGRDRVEDEIQKSLSEIDLRISQEREKQSGRMSKTDRKASVQKVSELDGERLGITVLAHRLGYLVSYKPDRKNGTEEHVYVRKYRSERERCMFNDGMWL